MSVRTLTALADPVHERVAVALDEARKAGGAGDRWALADAYDRVVADLSAHLIAMEVVVDSEYVRRVPHAQLTVRRQLELTRRIESVLRRLQLLLWGRPVPRGVTVDSARAELQELLARHRRDEVEMLRILDAALTEDERRALAERLDEADRHAPDRPHPHAPRSLLATKVMYRPVAAWDRFFDAQDSRPPRSDVPGHEPSGLWDGYLLGTPVPRRRDER